MLPQASPSIYQTPKCFVTVGSMGHLDPNQIPRKTKPWSTLALTDFIHRVDLVLPQEVFDHVREGLLSTSLVPSYHRVTMSLEQVLHGEFFTEYIKRGNILMLSEGTSATDNTFHLKEGILTMYLEKETYERAGLVGKPCGPKGNRGLKTRWVVTYNLRDPAMLHGRRSFDRLVYAAKHALSQPLRWLFCNLESSAPSPDPLQHHVPTRFTSSPSVREAMNVEALPLSISSSMLTDDQRTGLELIATELYEWLSLVRLESPRIDAGDSVDPYISRYQAPEGESRIRVKVCKLSWQGFMSPEWVRVLLAALLTSCPSESWFCMSATEFSKQISTAAHELTLLRPMGFADGYLIWEINDSS